MPVACDVEAHRHRDRGAAREHQRAGDMRRDLDRHARSRKRLAGDDALGPRPRRNAADASHRPEKIDEVGDIIGSHVEHRAAAGEVIEARVGMPALVARAHEERGAADRPADQPFVDRTARGLMGAAEERVGRAAEPQALWPPRRRSGRRASASADAERLLRMDVLAGGERLQADLDMRLRDREIEDDLDGRIGEHRIDRSAREGRIRPRALPPRRDWRRRGRRCRGSGIFSPPSDRRS